MQVCVTTSRGGSSETVDPRFGRCDQFTFIDTDTGEMTSEPNGLAAGAGGVGAKVAQFIADHGVQVVITGQVGPNAFRVLAAAGIDVYTAGRRTVREVLDDLREGRLTQASAATGPARHGGR